MTAANGIVTWTASPDEVADALWPQLDRLLDVAEQERARRFVFDRHRRQYRMAHAMKRVMLTAEAGGAIPPQAWAFEQGAQGKPRIARGMGPHFNLSHCDGLVACAVSRRVELGIDVESLDLMVPLEVADSYFSVVEQIWLRGLPAASQPIGFFQLWTLKEAYLKATGLGLARPLGAFAFSFDPLRVTFDDAAFGDPAEWHFRQFGIGTRHMLALAWQVRAAQIPVRVASVRAEALLSGETIALPI